MVSNEPEGRSFVAGPRSGSRAVGALTDSESSMGYIVSERVSSDMNKTFRALLALLAGAVTFLAVLVATTELLDPHIWPALIVTLPIALVAGALGVGFAYLGLRYREERAATGSGSPETVALLGGFSAGAGAFVVTATAVTAVLGAFAFPLLSAMLFGGLPAGTLVGITAGFLVARRLRRQRRGNDGSESGLTA